MPTLILLPGLHGTPDLFAPLLPHIPASLPTRILPYPPDRCRSYDHHFRRIEKELAHHSDLILFAESFSGPLAARFAAKHPSRVRALILCGTFITHPVPRILCYLATPFILLRFPLLNPLLRLFLAGKNAPSALLSQTRAAIQKNTPLTLAHRVQQAAWLDARKDLKALTVPTLILHGTRDRLVGPRAIRRLHRLRPDLPTHPFKAPHMLLESRPAEVWHAAAQFLSTLPHSPKSTAHQHNCFP